MDARGSQAWRQPALFLLAGLALGFSAGAAFEKRAIRRVWTERADSERIFSRLELELGLADVQKEPVRKALTRAEERIQALRADDLRKLSDVFVTLVEELRGPLTPQQHRRLQEVLVSWEQDSRKFWGQPPAP